MMKNLRSRWIGDKWVVDVDFALTPNQMKNVCDFLLRVQQQRLAGLMPGPVRDECLETIKALHAGLIEQNIAGTGDRVLFDAYKSDKIISLPTAQEKKESDEFWEGAMYRGMRDAWKMAGD